MQATVNNLSKAEHPTGLKEINDQPDRLFIRGAVPKERPVAIVGTRKPTTYGRRIASLLAARLAAAGVPIVSGLAFGIDTCAHIAALDAGGVTMAVLPGGIDRDSISPRTNLALADRMVEQGGALLSEWPNGTEPRKYYYGPRNRLISGVARAVVVVEAGLPSGSLVTAQHAADQGRELWAVPGLIDSPTSAGTNKLIADGAQVLHSIDEFLETLGISQAQQRFDFPDTPVHFDELAEQSDKSHSELETELTRLELQGMIKRLDGRYYVRA